MIKKNETSEILAEVSEYYTNKLLVHGAIPQGVDWNSHEGQEIRFEQLVKIIESSDFFTLNDLGCGYGGLHDYLKTQYNKFSYTGIDVSEEMILAAQKREHLNDAKYLIGSEPKEIADYGIASGIFNVKFERDEIEWFNYFEATLDILDRTSRRGFSFNCLTSYSDSDKMRNNLYYADPCKVFDYCKKRYSRQVALLHDYNLFEFTILVRKK